MNTPSSGRKTAQTPVHAASHSESAGADGAAIAHPAYGMDAVDHQPAEAAPGDHQEPQSLESIAWAGWTGAIQRKAASRGAGSSLGAGPQENTTGLPDSLKAGIESLSGLSMDDVRVHYNSAEPAQLQALAYTQGTQIHVGPGQERHLPHEAWHVVQQKQARVKPTLQAKGAPINDDPGLESEADIMGAKALGLRTLAATPAPIPSSSCIGQSQPIQRVTFDDVKVGGTYFYDDEEVTVLSKAGGWVQVQPKSGSKKSVRARDLEEPDSSSSSGDDSDTSSSGDDESASGTMFEKLGKGRGQSIGFTIAEGFTMPVKGKQQAIFRASLKRKKRSFGGEKEVQALRWVATVFFHLAIDKKKNPEEVQAALYKDRIVVAANTQTANNFLDTQSTGDAGADIYKAAKTLKDAEERVKRHSYKVRAAIVGLRATSKALATAFSRSLIVITAEDKDRPGLHAERRIAEYIDKQEGVKDAYLNYPIVGVKRPCTSCFLKLHYEKKPKYPPPSVGPHWSSTASNYGLDVMDIEGGKYKIPRSAVTETTGGELTIGYGSESDTDYSHSESELEGSMKKRAKK